MESLRDRVVLLRFRNALFVGVLLDDVRAPLCVAHLVLVLANVLLFDWAILLHRLSV